MFPFWIFARRRILERRWHKEKKNICTSLNSANPKATATLDMDATLVETNKRDALWCYKGFKSYQPLNTWWDEHGIILQTQFRDGNVPAGFDQLKVLKKLWIAFLKVSKK